MNFFKLYIGDYQRDTAHLSLVEHGAYLLMLQHYYATERPLPKGTALFRMLRASNKDEKGAILSILRQFWEEKDDGFINARALDEIKHRQAVRVINQEVGKLGGRPTKTESVIERKPINNPSHSQIPDTREDQEHRPTVLSPADADDAPAGKPEPIPYQQVVNAYNAACGDLFPQASRLTDKRRKAIRARWQADTTNDDDRKRTNSLDYWQRYFTYCRSGITFFAKAAAGESRGDHAGWRPDFDFLMTERAWLGVREGKYQ